MQNTVLVYLRENLGLNILAMPKSTFNVLFQHLYCVVYQLSIHAHFVIDYLSHTVKYRYTEFGNLSLCDARTKVIEFGNLSLCDARTKVIERH